jgi:hypothetical protein
MFGLYFLYFDCYMFPPGEWLDGDVLLHNNTRVRQNPLPEDELRYQMQTGRARKQASSYAIFIIVYKTVTSSLEENIYSIHVLTFLARIHALLPQNKVQGGSNMTGTTCV